MNATQLQRSNEPKRRIKALARYREMRGIVPTCRRCDRDRGVLCREPSGAVGRTWTDVSMPASCHPPPSLPYLYINISPNSKPSSAAAYWFLIQCKLTWIGKTHVQNENVKGKSAQGVQGNLTVFTNLGHRATWLLSRTSTEGNNRAFGYTSGTESSGLRPTKPKDVLFLGWRAVRGKPDTGTSGSHPFEPRQISRWSTFKFKFGRSWLKGHLKVFGMRIEADGASAGERVLGAEGLLALGARHTPKMRPVAVEHLAVGRYVFYGPHDQLIAFKAVPKTTGQFCWFGLLRVLSVPMMIIFVSFSSIKSSHKLNWYYVQAMVSKLRVIYHLFTKKID